ncbi:hypothetical protein ABRY23_12315 [Melioribacteraceae bacterium 4301-Me]|uniref:hypothetical protein n=1 Tax=Pyranulibacter aquaticus TaxID=3163344 RepID=UPI00359A7A1F
MKISFNNIGNYSPLIKANKTFNPNQVQLKTVEPQDLTKSEKKHFATIFPENKNEVMNYSFYGRTGKKSEVSLGTLIDKRG